ncbi:Saccharopine dehydrogenase NADP binding domain [Popillia japonica]|uniref:Saccharopine dehydrogenase NADP binding domain n=1 Tax=Popillia japonica TaxID=7064 RepID=A0AAW1M1V7_POPJA
MQQKTGEDYSKVPIILADINNIASIEEMTASAKIIMNAVGPYRFYGEKVVLACLNTGTHYVDISAEDQFMNLIQLKYHEAAKAKGIRNTLLYACGFDCIPIDLGVVFLRKNFKGTLNSVESYLYVREGEGPGATVNCTSYESIMYFIGNYGELLDLRAKLYPKKLPAFKPELPLKFAFFENEFLNRWCIIFPSADSWTCYRTQRYMFETHKQRPVQVNCYMAYNSFLHFIVTGIFAIVNMIFSQFSVTRYLLLKFPRFFTCGMISHEGPSEKNEENTFFDTVLVGKGWDEIQSEPTYQFDTPPRKIAKVSGKNPAYRATCIMFVVSALMILTESNKMPPGGGCYPPGAAFANTSMVEKLNMHEVKFEMDPKILL